ncbi:hypothetical protein ACHAXT_008322 [Thalassiosira profunda]
MREPAPTIKPLARRLIRTARWWSEPPYSRPETSRSDEIGGYLKPTGRVKSPNLRDDAGGNNHLLDARVGELVLVGGDLLGEAGIARVGSAPPDGNDIVRVWRLDRAAMARRDLRFGRRIAGPPIEPHLHDVVSVHLELLALGRHTHGSPSGLGFQTTPLMTVPSSGRKKGFPLNDALSPAVPWICTKNFVNEDANSDNSSSLVFTSAVLAWRRAVVLPLLAVRSSNSAST